MKDKQLTSPAVLNRWLVIDFVHGQPGADVLPAFINDLRYAMNKRGKRYPYFHDLLINTVTGLSGKLANGMPVEIPMPEIFPAVASAQIDEVLIFSSITPRVRIFKYYADFAEERKGGSAGNTASRTGKRGGGGALSARQKIWRRHPRSPYAMHREYNRY